MSTKSTLLWGGGADPPDKSAPAYHIYKEVLEDDGAVYLRIDGCEFECSNIHATIKIPGHIWNRILKEGVPIH